MVYFINPSDESQTKIRWIDNSKEIRIAAEAWIEGFIQNPIGLIERKLVNFAGSNRPEHYASGLLPNPKWDISHAPKIGFGGLDGFPVSFSRFTVVYLTLQSNFNSSPAGLLLQSSYFLSFLGFFFQLLFFRKHSPRVLLSLLIPYFLCNVFFFVTGMTVDGGRYYQTLNLILIQLLTIYFLHRARRIGEKIETG